MRWGSSAIDGTLNKLWPVRTNILFYFGFIFFYEAAKGICLNLQHDTSSMNFLGISAQSCFVSSSIVLPIENGTKALAQRHCLRKQSLK